MCRGDEHIEQLHIALPVGSTEQQHSEPEIDERENEGFPIPEANAGVEPWAVVVHVQHAYIA